MSKQSPKISIIIPVYKTEQYLERCMDSVLGQTFAALEILLIDDASPGGQICDRYANDSRVKVTHFTENRGLSAVRNEGLRQATAPYIGFVDSDDHIAPEMYEDLYNLAEAHTAQIVSSGMVRSRGCRDTARRVRELPRSHPDTARRVPTDNISVMTGREAFARLLLSHPAASHTACGKLYDRRLFAGISYPEGRIHEDAATTYKLYYNAKKIVHTNRNYYSYFLNRSGISNSGFSPKSMDKLTAAAEIIDFAEQNCPEFLPHAECFGIVTALRLAADFGKDIMEEFPAEYARVREILVAQNSNAYLSARHRVLLFLYKYCRPLFFAVWGRRLAR